MNRGRISGTGLVVVALICVGGSTPAVRARTTSVPAASPGEQTVLGLGDSVMAGTHCDCTGIMAGYAAHESTSAGRRIDPVDRGSNGATTGDLLADLRRRGLRDEVRRARIVIVIVGANDLVPQRDQWVASGCSRSCYAPAVGRMGHGLDQVLAAVAADRAGRAGPVLVCDYWNVFEDGEQTRATKGGALVEFGRRVTRLANQAICAAAVAHRARCVDLYDSALGPAGDPTHLLADDGDHPNAEGVAVIVSQLARATPAHTFTG